MMNRRLNLARGARLLQPVVGMLLSVLALSSPAQSQTGSDVARVLSPAYAGSIAVDASGDVFYAGTDSSAQTYTADGIYEMLAVNGVIPADPTIRKLASVGSVIISPAGLTVDPKGDVYLIDSGDETIKEIVAVDGSIPDSPTIRTVLSGIGRYGNITSDGSGNLFYLASYGTLGDESEYVYEVIAVDGAIPANPTISTLLTQTCTGTCQVGLTIAYPKADANGDLFLDNAGAVIELPAVNGIITPGETPRPISGPIQGDVNGIAVSLNGDLFVNIAGVNADDTDTSAIVEYAAVNGVIPPNSTPLTLYSVTSTTLMPRPFDMAADSKGDVFIANEAPQNILEVSPGNGAGGVAQAALTPAADDFGSVAVGNSSPAASFKLANAGAAALSITSVAVDGANPGDFVLGANTCGSTLAAGASCTLSVSFVPKSAGSASATLTVVDAVGTQTSSLTGSGSAAAGAQAALSPASGDFGTVTIATISSGIVFTLANAGNAALAISSVSLDGSNASDFSITGNTCKTSLAAGASCSITATFKPSAAAAETATLVVADSVGTQRSTLSGTGVAASTSADFSIAATPDSQTAVAGSSVDYTIDVGSSTGTFNQPVSLSASGLPPGATVTFSPAKVTPGAAGATATMTIRIAALSAANRLPPWQAPLNAPMLAILLGVPISLRRRSARRVFVAACIIIAAGSLQGCNGGFALPQNSLAQTATYTVTVIGTSAAIQHSTHVQISVENGAQ